MSHPAATVLSMFDSSRPAPPAAGVAPRPPAREVAPAYDADAVLDRLVAAVDGLAGGAVDELAEPVLRARLDGVQRQLRRLEAHRNDLVDSLRRREVTRAREQRPRDASAARHAERDVDDELRERLQLTPAEVRRTREAGRATQQVPEATREAYRAGDVPPDNLRKLRDTLGHFLGDPDARSAAERELLPAARTEDAVRFGDTCRRYLITSRPDAAQRDLDRAHARRSLRVSRDADGGLDLHGRYVGLGAELVATAIDTFHTSDGPDDRRPHDVRNADALLQALEVALKHATSTDHGNPVQVLLHVPLEALTDDATIVETAHAGPLPATEVRRLLDDSSLSRIVTGPDSLPIDTGRATRNVSAGIWRGLVARDGGCTWPGCDAPASWCQAAHLDGRWAKDLAGVSVAELALACLRHHRLLDRRRLVGRLEDGRVVWHPPDG